MTNEQLREVIVQVIHDHEDAMVNRFRHEAARLGARPMSPPLVRLCLRAALLATDSTQTSGGEGTASESRSHSESGAKDSKSPADAPSPFGGLPRYIYVRDEKKGSDSTGGSDG